MYNSKKVSAVFPAYNEEEGVGHAIKDFFDSGVVDEIVIVDNNSKDRTADIVKETKAKLVTELRQGYGWACQRALREATGDLIIIAEPDGTFMGKDVHKLLVYSEDFEVVLGTRTAKECIWDGANMNLFLRYGNVFVAKLLEYCFNGPSITDVGCTMKLFHRSALNKIRHKFTIGGSSFSPELMILAFKEGLKCAEVPLNYRERVGTSTITGGGFWPSFTLGLEMIWLIVKYRVGLK
jgi:glycosyltransferase involved in cell wall biosynthesis